MQMILRYPDGRRVDALLLSKDGNRLRVTTPERNDAVELRLTRQIWQDEEGHMITIEAMLTPQIFAEPAPIRRAAAVGQGPLGFS